MSTGVKEDKEIEIIGEKFPSSFDCNIFRKHPTLAELIKKKEQKPVFDNSTKQVIVNISNLPLEISMENVQQLLKNCETITSIELIEKNNCVNAIIILADVEALGLELELDGCTLAGNKLTCLIVKVLDPHNRPEIRNSEPLMTVEGDEVSSDDDEEDLFYYELEEGEDD